MSNTASLRDILLTTRSVTEANRILESKGMSASSKELMRTAIGIQDKQPDTARQFRETVIADMEKEDEDKKKMKEVDGGESHQSTRVDGTQKLGADEPKQNVEGMDDQVGAKDQMGAIVNETHGGMPNPMMMDPMTPNYQQMMQPPQQPPAPQPPQQAPPMQQAGNHHPMQQMQYTLNHVVESIKKLDAEIRAVKETQEQQKPVPTSLEVGSRIRPGAGELSPSMLMRETTAGTPTSQKLGGWNEDYITSRSARIASDSNDLTRLNDYLSSTEKTPGVQ